jgi:hypothetical protein
MKKAIKRKSTRLTPAMIAAGIVAARGLLKDYSSVASYEVSDAELTLIIETVGIAMLSAEEPTP